MEVIRDWALSLCLAALAGMMVHILTPAGNMDRIVKTVVAVFMLCALFSPLLLQKNIELKLPENTDVSQNETYLQLEETLRSEMEEQVKRQITELVKAELEKSGIHEAKIRINMDTNEDNRISINSVTLVLPPEQEDKVDTLRKSINDNLGLDANIRCATQEEANNAGSS